MTSQWKDFTWINEPGSWVRDGKVEEGKEEGRNGSWSIGESGELTIAPDAKKV